MNRAETAEVVPWTADTCPRDCAIKYRSGLAVYHPVQRLDRGLAIVQGGDDDVALYKTVTWEELLREWEQHDGSPCGSVEE